MEEAENEWEKTMRMVANAEGKAKAKLIEGLPFVHSSIVSAIKLQLHSIEKKKETDKQENIRRLREQEILLTRIEDNFGQVCIWTC